MGERLVSNLFTDIPADLSAECFEQIISTGLVRIERIISYGHHSPESGWYNQTDNEWVIVLCGYGIIEFEDGRQLRLNKGDYINIKAHEKHRVKATSADEITLWLAIFYPPR